MSETDTNEGFVPVETIFAGRRTGDNKKPFILFYIAGKGDETAEFDSKTALRRFRHAVIGGVYQHMRKDGSFKLSERYLRYSGDERVATWKAADEAHEVSVRAKKLLQEARDGSKKQLATAIEPFRAEYAGTDYIGKLALEVVLLAALRRGI